MPLLVRKIKRAKWPNAVPANAGELPADSLTCGCLKTKGNKMSTWRIANKEELDRALLAIVMSNTEVETFDVVCLDQDVLAAAAIALENTPGETKVVELRDSHVDIAKLNHNSLGQLGLHAATQICGDNHVRCRIPKIIALVKAAIDQGKLLVADIHPDYLKKLQSQGLPN